MIQVKVKVFRYNPESEQSKPRFDEFTVEADPKEKKISKDSPLGKALMGKKVGEKVEVEAPAGKVTYTIHKIH